VINQPQCFGKPVLIKYETGHKKRSATFRCDCGNTFIARVENVCSGNTKSCGCLKTKHGMTDTLTYRSWDSMISRCCRSSKSNYSAYGGRGIRVCDEWRIFTNFLRDMGVRPGKEYQLDRINNDGNYEPSNCRWVKCAENIRKKQSTKLSEDEVREIRSLLCGGTRNCDLSRRFGVSQATICDIKNGRAWVGV